MTNAIAWTAAQAVTRPNPYLRTYRRGTLLLKIIKVLQVAGVPMEPRGIALKTGHPPKSVSSALRQLLDDEAIIRTQSGRKDRWLYAIR